MGEGPRPARRCLAIAVATLLSAGCLIVAQPKQTNAAEQCERAAVMNHRLDELGRSGYAWTMEPLDGPGPGGVTWIDEHAVKISPSTPCAWMVSVVSHEWMHVQQGWKYGSSNARVYAAYSAFEVEMVADCGSMILGSTVTPYIDQHRHETGSGCSEYELVAARALIDKAPRAARMDG